MLASIVRSVTNLAFGARLSSRPVADPAPEPEPSVVGAILVPQSAYDAWPDAPEPLIAAVRDFVGVLMTRGHFYSDELPQAALQAARCAAYRDDVLTGGHSRFVTRSRLVLEDSVNDVLRALRILDLPDHLALAQAM